MGGGLVPPPPLQLLQFIDVDRYPWLVGALLDRAPNFDRRPSVAAARKIMDPASDTRGTPQYRISVGGAYVARAIKSALARAAA